MYHACAWRIVQHLARMGILIAHVHSRCVLCVFLTLDKAFFFVSFELIG